MPQVWSVLLTSLHRGPLPMKTAHAFASCWLGHDQNPAPWSLSRHVLGPGSVLLLMHVLDDRIVPIVPAHHRLAADQQAMNAGADGVTDRVTTESAMASLRTGWRVSAGPAHVAEVPWAELRAGVPGAAWRLHLLSPTAWSAGQGAWAAEPDGDRLARSVVDRWRGVAPGECPFPRHVTRPPALQVIRSDVVAVATVVKGRPIEAITGTLDVTCPPGDVTAARAVLAFIQFAGTGRYTAHGLGRVDVEALPPEQPARPC